MPSAIAIATETPKAPPPLFKPASLKPVVHPAAPSLESLLISPAQCDKALNALLGHIARVQEKREEEELLGEREEKVFLVVGLKRAAKREVHMPVRLPLPHPVMDPRVSPVTLFVKDPQRTYKDLLATSKISFISRVVGLKKLQGKHKTFEAKRALLKEADAFLVDDRVVVDVGKQLGKMWREAKKQPVPVAISRKDLKAELERAISSTYLQISTGTSLSVKFGTTSLHNPSQLLANLLALIPQLAARAPNGGWDNIQSLHIKTSTSAALPIYNCDLTDAGRFSGISEVQKAEMEAKRVEKAEKEKAREEKEQEKEKRRIERSATKTGKGRAEKKRKRDESEEGGDEVDEVAVPKKSKSKKVEVIEEVDLPLTEPIVEAAGEVKKSKKPKKEGAEAEKKAKKAKKVKA